MSRFLSLSLALFTMFSTVSGLFVRPGGNVAKDNDDFVPILRFAVASDIHTEFLGGRQNRRLAKMIKSAYAAARSHETYKDLDGLLLAGDVTDRGYKFQYLAFQSVLNANILDETSPMVILAKSHDCSTMKKDALDFYEELSGLTTDFHKIIKGFHFIGISTTHDRDTDDKYSQAQLQWLDNELAAAVADAPDKPIFVSHHEHVLNTVYGSREDLGERWGTPEFYDILAKYPQVVDFSGHSHYPLNDPRSIWQGDFTALGTSTLYYYEFTVDDVKTYHPKNNKKASQYWLVEVDAANRVRLRGYDLIGEAFVCEYIIEKPADKNTFAYTPEKMQASSSPPAFEAGAKAKVKNI
ncbi:MAG TPA: metallophosphoesterase, partial [Clostridiales bacterium]|nr:metallophosphoesterase [Clostridiales bacterium]